MKVLYDQAQIADGDEWRRRISYLLHACDGAVIMLDEAALASDWVLAEAMFLSIRATYDEGFRLVPVSFLPRAALRKHLTDGPWRRSRCPCSGRGVVISIPALPDESALTRYNEAAAALTAVARATELPDRYAEAHP